MIQVKFATLVDPDFNRALSALKQNPELPMLHLRRLDKILEALQRELKRYREDVEKRRAETFQCELSAEQQQLVLSWGTDKLDQCFRDLGYTPEQEADFRAKFQQVDEYCEELGKEEVRLPAHEKLRLPDTFKMSYSHAKALTDLITLE